MDGDRVFRRAVVGDDTAVSALFAEVIASGADRWFHPHPFTATSARELCAFDSRDFYALAVDTSGCVGWAMLRGWDAGYTVPSLGIYVAERARGRGLGRDFMAFLHGEAERRGAPAIRLKVYPDNERAVGLYRSLGYHFAAELEHGQLVGRFVFRCGEGTSMDVPPRRADP